MKNCRCLIAGQRQFVYILFHFLITHDIASGGGCFHKQRPLSLGEDNGPEGGIGQVLGYLERWLFHRVKIMVFTRN
ncbi:MAG: hypothetical protein ACOCOM_04005, partial [Prevotella sp.]